jgi:nitrogen fixation/metabolism regulation signal transduction histidine kinase
MSLESADQELLRSLLDAIPSCLFLVDESLEIILFNTAATRLVGEARTQVLHRRTGEALHCLNADHSLGGCGTTEACRTCIIRGSMIEAFETGKMVSRRSKLVRAEGGKTQDMFMQISASPFTHAGQRLVVLMMEDISSTVELQRLIPICSKCRKVRDDKDYWTRLDEYARDHLGADFTHGYCPDCFKEEVDAMERRYPKKPGTST